MPESAEPDRWTRDLIAGCTFPPPKTRLVCAVSGGADSLALMCLAVAAGCEVTAVHVDHGIREGSAREAEGVATAASRVGASFRAERVRVAPGPNLEARARSARFSVLPLDVATGHTADDQAETVLLNLLRGAGRDGLAGMRPGWRHPILALRRSQTVELCHRMGLVPIEDPTNTDPAHLRNRVRHELIPLMSEAASRDVVVVLARQAGLMAEESDLLDLLALELDPTEVSSLSDAPVALARRAIREWLQGAGTYPPSSGSVERVMAVVRKEIRSCEVEGGLRVTRSAGKLRIASQTEL
ncbi:MAG: tRNA lysidine(34) synthetase TilS [Acidimicrobiales bacterium]